MISIDKYTCEPPIWTVRMCIRDYECSYVMVGCGKWEQLCSGFNGLWATSASHFVRNNTLVLLQRLNSELYVSATNLKHCRGRPAKKIEISNNPFRIS